MSLIFDLVTDILFFPISVLFGALIGVLYPPKSPKWARRQKTAAALGGLALLALAAAGTTAWLTDESPVVWPMILLAVAALTGFAIIGDACRRHHERGDS